MKSSTGMPFRRRPSRDLREVALAAELLQLLLLPRVLVEKRERRWTGSVEQKTSVMAEPTLARTSTGMSTGTGERGGVGRARGTPRPGEGTGGGGGARAGIRCW